MKWPFRKRTEEPQPPEPTQPPASAEAAGERSIAIGGDNYGIALTGDNATVVAPPPEALRPAAEVDAPPGLDNLRSSPHLFVGRTRELDRLDAALAAPGRAVVQAVHGLGGIGKSTLAAHWAATRAHGCAPVRWINAGSPADVQQGLAELARALQPALANALLPETLAERALQWLATHTGWLLILDNVNDPADIASLTQGPATGRLLITSRLATTWNRVATTVVRLGVLDPNESLDLLTRIITAAGPRDLDGSTELCAELGHLPLAIEQAAAYLVENQLTTPTPVPTWTSSPSTPRTCTATPPSVPRRNAPWPGSGASPWTASPASTLQPATCYGPWPGTPPTTSPPPWPAALPTRPHATRRLAYSLPTA